MVKATMNLRTRVVSCGKVVGCGECLVLACILEGIGLMKFLPITMLLTAVTTGGPAFAKVEQCRFINAKPEREACYDRQAKALEAKKAEADAKQKTNIPPEHVKAEDGVLSRQIRSICRGC